MASIELENVGLVFRVRRQRRIPLKEYVLQRMFRSSINPIVEVRSLQNVSLRIGEGERVGIIGHNGAGKSTLLKVLAGVYPPTSGRRTVEGAISSVFDFALGFEPHASGRENIRYRGYLQGETPRSIRAKLDSIIEFSELGEFIDTPVRFYSAGMRLRLGFSIATAIEPEILLVDECLSAGDLAFRKKAQQRMRETMDRARLIVMVSHDLEVIRGFCGRVIWMEQGRIRQDGLAADVIEAYWSSSGKSRPASDAGTLPPRAA
ncbi:MAG TPA: ABC transporter ATP-binding protein [Planctomycetaceae bacterium]|nr:ABC transporter ATP-binding protein [Planctomycetaceae bacterium]